MTDKIRIPYQHNLIATCDICQAYDTDTLFIVGDQKTLNVCIPCIIAIYDTAVEIMGEKPVNRIKS